VELHLLLQPARRLHQRPSPGPPPAAAITTRAAAGAAGGARAAPNKRLPAAYFTTQGLLQLSTRKGGQVTFYRCVRGGLAHGQKGAAAPSVQAAAAVVAAVAEELGELLVFHLGGGAARAAAEKGATAPGGGRGAARALPAVLEDPQRGCLMVEVPEVAVLEGFKVHLAVARQADGSSCQFGLGALLPLLGPCQAVGTGAWPLGTAGGGSRGASEQEDVWQQPGMWWQPPGSVVCGKYVCVLAHRLPA
jgi:hypothetical protein